MRWIVQHPDAQGSLLTKSNSTLYLDEDVDVFSWSLSDNEMAILSALNCSDNNTCGGLHNRMTWGCTE